MRIEEIYIEGFGHFQGARVGPFASPVTLLHGPNEAGKSTLLAFIRTILFGFPVRGGASHYPPLAGGRHGGRLTLADEAGNRFVVERFQGARGGQLVIMTGDGAPVAESSLPGLIGHVSRDIFNSVFAFSLDELQSGEFLKDQSVNGQIYSAGLGASRLPQAIIKLNALKDELFRKRGSKNVVAGLVTELRDIDNKLAEIRGNAAEYGDHVARQAGIGEEIEAITGERTSLQKRINELERLKEGRADWLSLVEIDTDLANLPAFESFPTDAKTRLESAERSIDERRVDVDESLNAIKIAEVQAIATFTDEALTKDRSVIGQIRRGRSSLDDSVKDLPERHADLRGLETSLRKRVRDLSPDWNEERLDSFDTSMSVQEEISLAQTGHAELDNELRDRRAESKRAERELRESGETESEARHKVEEADNPRFDSEGIARRRNEIRAARTRWDIHERARLRHQDLEAQLESVILFSARGGDRVSAQRWLPPMLLAVAGVAVAVVGALTGGAALFISIGLGVALAAVAAYVFIAGAKPREPASTPADSALEERVRTSAEAVSEAKTALREATAHLNLDDPDGDGLDSKEAELNAANDALQAVLSLKRQLGQASRDVQTGERRVSQASEALEETTVKQETARREWRDWLRARSVPEMFTPDTMAEFRTQVDAARLELGEVRRMRRRIEAIELDIQQHRDLVAPLTNKHGIEMASEDGLQMARAADTLIDRFDAANKRLEHRENTTRDLQRLHRDRENREQRLEQAKSVLAQLLEAGGSASPEELRQRAEWHRQRTALESQRQEKARSLERLSGPGQESERFRERLRATAQQEIEDELAQLSEEAGRTENARTALSEERGGIETRLKLLYGDEQASQLHAQRNVLMEQLLHRAREWSTLTLAEDLLQRARRKFEEERQPGVIRHASKVFERITHHRYDRLYAPIGQQTVTVTDRTGVRKQPAELSRGAREQLYLAVRFGLIREFGERSERLPVVVDEVLVNFDPDRAERAASAFAELSRTNQLLVFTCHPHLVDLFTSVIPDAQLIHINFVDSVADQ